MRGKLAASLLFSTLGLVACGGDGNGGGTETPTYAIEEHCPASPVGEA